MLKSVAIIQARMKSSRLPGKALAPLRSRPAIEHVIRRVSAAERIEAVVSAVSDDTESDRIAEWIEGYAPGAPKPLSAVRGPERNCIARFIEAANACPADIYIRATADNPLVDPNIISLLIEMIENKGCDYAGCPPELHLGLGAEAFTAKALRTTAAIDTEKFEKECVTYPMYSRPELFQAGNILIPRALLREKRYRLTLDTEEDCDLLRRIFEQFGEDADKIETYKILNWLDAHPEIADINRNIEQKPAQEIDW